MKFVVAILFMCLMRLSAQITPADCKKLLKEYIEKTSTINKLGEGQCIFMDVGYKITSYEDPVPLVVNTKYYTSNNLSYYENNKVNVYMDKKDFFVVVHSTKNILHNDPISNDSVMQTVYNSTFQLRDSILRFGALVGCYQNGSNINVSYMTNEKYKRKTKVEVITYTFEGKEMKSINIKYTPDNKVARTEVTYNKLDLNYGKLPYNSAKAFVLEGNGKLKSKYNGYSLLDNRLNK